MKNLIFVSLLLFSFGSYSSEIGDFKGVCQYIDSYGKTIYSGKCSYKQEIFKENDRLAVDVVTLSFKNNSVRIVKYPNGAASVNDIPSIAKSHGEKITVTTGEGEVFIFGSE